MGVRKSRVRLWSCKRMAHGSSATRGGVKSALFAALAIALLTAFLSSPQGALAARASSSSDYPTLSAELDQPLLIKFMGPTSYQNPLNTSQVEVNAYFDAPSGSIFLPCYPYSVGVWAVRFTPLQQEDYTYRVVMRNSSGTFLIASGEIRVLPAPTHMAFVMAGSHYFYAGGKPLFMVGEDVAWASSPGDLTGGWEYYVGKLAENGGNWVRLWSPYAATWFSANYSSLLDFAMEHGVYVQLCLFSPYSGQSFSEGPEWAQVTPAAFFSSPKMIKLEEFWIRSLIGRYSAFPNLFSWELFNEVDASPGYNSTLVAAWVRTMVSYIEANDPYHHMITVSVSNPANGFPLFSIPGISYAQLHLYGSGPYAIPGNLSYWIGRYQAFHKPILVAEFGASYKGAVQDPAGVSLELGLWSALASGSAGTAMTWWWDSFVDPNGLYFYFRSVENVVGELNLSGFSPASVQAQYRGALSPFVGAISNGTAALIYAVNPEIAQNWMNYYAHYWLPETTLNVTVGMSPGSYEVEFWDPVTGMVSREFRYLVGQQGRLTLQLNFSAALVVTITPSAYLGTMAPGSERVLVVSSNEERLVVYNVCGRAVAVLHPSVGNDSVVLPVGRYEAQGIWFNLTAGTSPYALNLEAAREAQFVQEAALTVAVLAIMAISAFLVHERGKGKRRALRAEAYGAAGEEAKGEESATNMYNRLLGYYSLNMGFERGARKLEAQIAEKMAEGMSRDDAIRAIYEEVMG